MKCLDCCCGNPAEVRRCPMRECPLWRYRMGKEVEFCEDAEDFQPNSAGQALTHPGGDCP